MVELDPESESLQDDISLDENIVYYESLLLDHPEPHRRCSNVEVTSPSHHPLARQIYQLTVLFHSSSTHSHHLHVGNAIHLGDGLFLTPAHLLRMPSPHLDRISIFASAPLSTPLGIFDLSLGPPSSLQLTPISYLHPSLPRGQVLPPNTHIPPAANLALLRTVSPMSNPTNEGFPVPTWFPNNVKEVGVTFVGVNQVWGVARGLMRRPGRRGRCDGRWDERGKRDGYAPDGEEEGKVGGGEVHGVMMNLLPGKVSWARGRARYEVRDGAAVVLHDIPVSGGGTGAAICAGRELYAIHTGPSLRPNTGSGRSKYMRGGTGAPRNVAVPLCTKQFKAFLAREVIPCLKTREVREAWEGFIEL